ncbi:MAG: 2-amino-4-oxopentanoate thiolase subunit OrtA [bacterium]
MTSQPGVASQPGNTPGPSRRWVEVGFVVLEPGERTARLPEDTKGVPYYVKVKGFADGEPQVGQTVTVETLLGRHVQGEVLRIDPEYGHSFGRPVEELIDAGKEARTLLRSLEGHE